MVCSPLDPLDHPFYEDSYINGEFCTVYTTHWSYGSNDFEERQANDYFDEYDAFIRNFQYWKRVFFESNDYWQDDDAMEEDSQETTSDSLYSTEDIDQLPDSEDDYVPGTPHAWQRIPADQGPVHIMDQLLDDWLEYQMRLEREEPTHPSLMDLWDHNNTSFYFNQ